MSTWFSLLEPVTNWGLVRELSVVVLCGLWLVELEGFCVHFQLFLPGGHLDIHVDGGGVPLGVENLTLSQWPRCTKKTPCHKYLTKNVHMHTLSQYFSVAGAQIAGLS